VTFRLIVKQTAEKDIALGRDFYYAIRPLLARDYLLEIERCIDLILQNPFRRAEEYKKVRRLHLRRFPYVISYLVEVELVVVIAVTHNRRHSSEWESPLP